MKTKAQLAVFASLLLIVSGTALAQDVQEFEFNNDSQEIEGVNSYSLVISALPAEAEVEDSESGEVEAEKEFENESDEDTNFSITREEALAQAREELGSDEWNLESTDRDDEGLYEFSFIRGESEAEVTVDASSGEVIALEGEIEYEPEERREEPVISLSGYMVFNTGGYEVDIESEEENNNVDFTVTIDEPDTDEMVTQALTRVSVEETEEVEGGTSNVSLEVIMENETVLERNRQLEIPATETENDSEETEREETERKQLQEMSREELVNQVRELRERVRDLESRLGDGTPTDEETQRDNETEEETEDEETEEQEDEQETEEGGPEDTPGQGSERRPGFVNSLLSGLFG